MTEASPPVSRKAGMTAIRADMTVSEAFAAVLRSELEHLQANEPGVLRSDDPEFLHQMRVAVRRLRSALSVFAQAVPDPARKELAADLKWLGAALGPARDWDVFVGETLPRVLRAHTDHAALATLSLEASRARSEARRALRRRLRAPKYQAVMSATSSWIEHRAWREGADGAALAALDRPVRRYAEGELEARYERVRKRGRALRQMNAEELHRLRIALKKLRYSIDFFASLYDAEPVRRLRSRVSRLQDILGIINDAATVKQLVHARFMGSRAPAAAEARGILLGWSQGRADALAGELDRAWRPFRRSRTYW